MKKAISGLVLTIILTMLLAFNIKPVEAELRTIYIRADGSIDPPTVAIKRDGNTYVFTDNIIGYSIVIKRSDIVIDGAGHLLYGTAWKGGCGFYLSDVQNVTIKNTNIKLFEVGIHLVRSSNNIIFRNNIANNDFGIDFDSSSNNKIYHNSFINNAQQVYILSAGCVNIWDDNYPSGGNYWSDYTDVDNDNDGIWDHPYVIDVGNKDHYPLVKPPSDFFISASPFSRTITSGESTTFTIILASISGFSFPVELSSSIEPDTGEISSTFNPETVTPVSDGSTLVSKLIISTTTMVAPATYTITITGRSGEKTRSTNVKLTIYPIPWWVKYRLLIITGIIGLILSMIVPATVMVTRKKRGLPASRPLIESKIEKEIRKYEEYLEKLEQLKKERKVSQEVYEKLKKEYEKKIEELMGKMKK